MIRPSLPSRRHLCLTAILATAAAFSLRSTALAASSLVESFEPNPADAFPIGWNQRFGSDGSHGEKVSDAVAFDGTVSLRNAGQGSWASELLSNSTFEYGDSGTAMLVFSLYLSSETNVPNPTCDNAIVVFRGSHWSISCGIETDGNGGYRISHSDTSYSDAPVPIEVDRWYQFTAVIEPETDTVDWFVDGVLIIDDFPLFEGDTNSQTRDRLGLHTGCISSGEIVAHYDSIRFIGMKQTCEGDLHVDEHVDSVDLLILLSAWGTCP